MKRLGLILLIWKGMMKGMNTRQNQKFIFLESEQIRFNTIKNGYS